MPLITEERLKKVFASATPFSNDAEKQKCQELVLQLEEEEQEQAALTSYAYAMAARFPEIPTGTDLRLKMAMRFARRHLIAEKGDKDVALTKMKETLLWRTENRINELRYCFDDAYLVEGGADGVEDTVKNRMAKYRYQVEDEFAKQPTYVTGFDLSGRAIIVRFHRNHPDSIQENHLIYNVYLVEKAMACTELSSNGLEDKVLVASDFRKYNRSNNPPPSVTSGSIKALQKHYPAALKYFVVVWGGNALVKALVKTLWFVVKVLLNAETKETVHFVFTEKNRDDFFKSRVSVDEAMPFMIPNGKKPEFVEMKKVLYGTPFTCAVHEEDS